MAEEKEGTKGALSLSSLPILCCNESPSLHTYSAEEEGDLLCHSLFWVGDVGGGRTLLYLHSSGAPLLLLSIDPEKTSLRLFFFPVRR